MTSTGTPMRLSVTCVHCGAEKELYVNSVDIFRWQAGELIQNCMPYMSAADRELFISRTCDNCWKNLFGDDDAEE